MTKDEQFALAKEQVLKNINCWADLYEFFDAIMDRVHETLHPGMVFDALFTMYAFLHAMKELPEEGDIRVIAEKMLYILVYESEDKLGAKVTILSGAEAAQGRTAAKVREMAAAAISEALSAYEADQEITKTDRVLH